MSSLLSTLPETILNSLKNRTVSLNELVQFTIAIRAKVNKFDNTSTPKLFWKMCAINELHELMAEFPWQVWKPKFNIDYHKARLEAVDVITLTIGAVSVNNEINIDWYSNQLITTVDFVKPEEFTPNNFSKNIDKISTCINKIDKDINIWTHDEERNFVTMVRFLCIQTKMKYEDLNIYIVLKLLLVLCRINHETGVYNDDWHKVSKGGISETTILQQLVDGYYRHPDATLYQMCELAELLFKDFRY